LLRVILKVVTITNAKDVLDMNTQIIKEEVIIHEHIRYEGMKRFQTNEIVLNDQQYSYLLAQAERMEKLDKETNETINKFDEMSK
jgi:hypothetical protein